MNGFLLTEINDGALKKAERDQAACMCRLILLYTSHAINPWLQMAG